MLCINNWNTSSLVNWYRNLGLATRNARLHSPQQVTQIAHSIKQFGFINPVVIDESGSLLAGHGRLLAAEELGLTSVPAIRVSDLSESEKRAYMLADNKLTENAAWDTDLLRVELSYLNDVNVDIDVDITGFSPPELDIILNPEPIEEPEDAPPPPPSHPVTRHGDIWLLNQHRIACGDCRDKALVAVLMENNLAQLMVTDPPYNVKIAGHARGKGKAKHREFAMASGEMDSPTFTQFLQSTLSSLADVSHDGALHYVFMDWRHSQELLEAASSVYEAQVNLCVFCNNGVKECFESMFGLLFFFADRV